MTELVAYDDSPLGQYLQEIDAAEDLVADEKPAASSTADSGLAGTALALRSTLLCSGLRHWIESLAASILESPADSVDEQLYAAVWEQTVTILAQSGHMEPKYTPRPGSRFVETDSQRQSIQKAVDGKLAMKFAARQTMPSLALTSVLAMAMRSNGSSTRDVLLASLYTPTAAILASTLWWHMRGKHKARRLQTLVDSIRSMAQSCRSMDNSVQRALRFIQEIEFVINGFRLPRYHGSLATAANTGHGTAIAAGHMRKAMNKAIQEASDVLLDTIIQISTSTDYRCAVTEDADTDTIVAEMKGCYSSLYGSDGLSLEALRSKFELHFSLRRLWLELLLMMLEPKPTLDVIPKQAFRLSMLGLIEKSVHSVAAAAEEGAKSIKQVEGAQYTSKRWAALLDTKSTNKTSAHPLVRSLNRMANTLETIQAKMHICREFIGLEEEEEEEGETEEERQKQQCKVGGMETSAANEGSADEISRLFSSLKSEIDVLNSQYQAAFTNLVCSDQDMGGENSEKNKSQWAVSSYESSLSAIPEESRIVGYSPIDAELDVPEMVFEADIEADNSNASRKRSSLDRSERIRLQRQRREDEAAARKRKGEISSVLSELKSAIGDRIRPSAKQASE